ncbi:MAG: hypothetical protein ACXABG_06870 [Promethearchaeota archaeon]|jgi:hypothetical protein
MKEENRNFFISLIVTICLTTFLTLFPVWQLIIIPGIIAGIINKSLKYGVFSGFLGVTLAWGLYMMVGMITRNVYSMLDQLGGLIFGEGFGWVFIVLPLLIAAIFGAFGGGIGNGMMTLFKIYQEKYNSRDSKAY